MDKPSVQTSLETLMGETSGKGRGAVVALVGALGKGTFDPVAPDADGVPWCMRALLDGHFDAVLALHPLYGDDLLLARDASGNGLLDAGWEALARKMAEDGGRFSGVGLAGAMQAFARLLEAMPARGLSPRGYQGERPADEWLYRIVSQGGSLDHPSHAWEVVRAALRVGGDPNLRHKGVPIAQRIGNYETLHEMIEHGLDLTQTGYDPAHPETPGWEVLERRYATKRAVEEWKKTHTKATMPAVHAAKAAAPEPKPATRAVASVIKGVLYGDWEHRAWRNIPVIWLALGHNCRVFSTLTGSMLERTQEALRWRGTGDTSPWLFALPFFVRDRRHRDGMDDKEAAALNSLLAWMEEVPIEGGARGLVGSVFQSLLPDASDDIHSSYSYRGRSALHAMAVLRNNQDESFLARGRFGKNSFPWEELWGKPEHQGLLAGRVLGLLAQALGRDPRHPGGEALDYAKEAMQLWASEDAGVRCSLDPRLNGAFLTSAHMVRSVRLLSTFHNHQISRGSYDGSPRSQRREDERRARYADSIDKALRSKIAPCEAPVALADSDRAVFEFVRDGIRSLLVDVVERVRAGGVDGGGKKDGEATIALAQECLSGWDSLVLSMTPATPARQAARRRLA